MVKWSVKIFFDRELHRMHLRKSSLQNSSALVQTLFLQKSTEKSLLIPMRSIKSAQCYISRTISRRQKFFCENRPIFGMIRDAEVRGGGRMQKDRSRNWDQRFDAERFWQRYEQRERKRSIERTARILILLFAVLAPFFLVMFVIVVG